MTRSLLNAMVHLRVDGTQARATSAPSLLEEAFTSDLAPIQQCLSCAEQSPHRRKTNFTARSKVVVAKQSERRAVSTPPQSNIMLQHMPRVARHAGTTTRNVNETAKSVQPRIEATCWFRPQALVAHYLALAVHGTVPHGRTEQKGAMLKGVTFDIHHN